MSQIVKQAKEIASHCQPWQIAVMGCTIALGLLYIWQVTVSGVAGFTMRDLNREIQSLSAEQEGYEMEVARLQSIESITTRVQMLGLTKVENVDFVGVVDAAVAINN